tara:strand:- start:697 stop:981 length:285 start_codon:yes stop_codon:yes gene_type:complete
MSGNSRPDYTIKVNEKGSKYGTKVGSAWLNKTQNGAEYLSIQINPGCVLEWNKDLSIRMWKNDQEQASLGSSSNTGAGQPMFDGPQGGGKALWE